MQYMRPNETDKDILGNDFNGMQNRLIFVKIYVVFKMYITCAIIIKQVNLILYIYINHSHFPPKTTN